MTWNCNMALRLKFDRLRSLRPDVAIVQECADPHGAATWRPDCTSCDWVGLNPDKGLGIFTFGDLALARHTSYSEQHAFYLPVTVSGRCSFNLLGVWVAGRRPASAPLTADTTNDPLPALQHYRPFLAAGPSVVAGDFNRLPQQISRRNGAEGSSVADVLAGAGLANADYAVSDAAGQGALRRTHYHQRKLTRGFVLDYIFIPAAEASHLTAFEVCDPHDWIQWSDHVPLVAEFDLAPGSTLSGATLPPAGGSPPQSSGGHTPCSMH